MATIASNNISFSGLKANYNASGTNINASGNSDLRDGKLDTEISMSDFAGMKLSNNKSIPSSNISINDDFKGKIVLIPVTSVTLAISASNASESTTFANFATANILPSTANGSLTIKFFSASNASGSIDPATPTFQNCPAGTNKMNYTTSAVSSNQTVGNISVEVTDVASGNANKTAQSETITIIETSVGPPKK